MILHDVTLDKVRLGQEPVLDERHLKLRKSGKKHLLRRGSDRAGSRAHWKPAADIPRDGVLERTSRSSDVSAQPHHPLSGGQMRHGRHVIRFYLHPPWIAEQDLL